jgi:AraC family transcriptional regulator
MASGTLKRQEYWARINRAVDYIERNLSKELLLTEVASAAHFSPFHFHRLFRSIMGETVSQFVQRIRLEKAANQLLANPGSSVTRVALDCGYGSSAAFARAFRAAHGMTPSQWRSRCEPPPDENTSRIEAQGGTGEESKLGKQESKGSIPVRKAGKEPARSPAYSPDTEHSNAHGIRRRENMPTRDDLDVRVEELDEMTVAYVRHVGPYKGDEALFKDLFARLWKWAGPRDLLQFPKTKAIIVYHDHPEITEEEKLRTSVCITVPGDTAVSGEVGKMAIPGGRYAMARFELAGDEYQEAWDTVYGGWLPESGYQPADWPAFELYHSGPDQHPEGKFVLDICVPVKPL